MLFPFPSHLQIYETNLSWDKTLWRITWLHCNLFVISMFSFFCNFLIHTNSGRNPSTIFSDLTKCRKKKRSKNTASSKWPFDPPKGGHLSPEKVTYGSKRGHDLKNLELWSKFPISSTRSRIGGGPAAPWIARSPNARSVQGATGGDPKMGEITCRVSSGWSTYPPPPHA